MSAFAIYFFNNQFGPDPAMLLNMSQTLQWLQQDHSAFKVIPELNPFPDWKFNCGGFIRLIIRRNLLIKYFNLYF